jgi:hypothetical protein
LSIKRYGKTELKVLPASNGLRLYQRIRGAQVINGFYHDNQINSAAGEYCLVNHWLRFHFSANLHNHSSPP